MYDMILDDMVGRLAALHYDTYESFSPEACASHPDLSGRNTVIPGWNSHLDILR